MKDQLAHLSEASGRTMIDILETGIRLQEDQAEFKVNGNGFTLPSLQEMKNSDGNGNNRKPKKTARVNTGFSTNDLILSCHQDGNDMVFEKILPLYLPIGSRVADSTYGKGVFWKRVDIKQYVCLFSDLKVSDLPPTVKGGVDARRLPYKDCFLDGLVFDPPYMHSPGGTAHNGHQNFENYYANNVEADQVIVREIWEDTNGRPPKYHEAVLDLYFRAAREAWRVLKVGGVYFVKCQDEVCANRNRFTHVEIMNELARYGFSCEDLFVVMRVNKPGVSRLKGVQAHARKNHSYFLVFRKTKPVGSKNYRGI